MKKKTLQLTAIALSTLMAGSLAACGSSSSSSGDAGTSSSEASTQDSTASDGSSSSDSMPTISIMLPSYNGTDLANDHSDEVIAKYEEYTQTKVEWDFEANDTYDEKLGMTLMDRDNMPMILTGKGNISANVVDAAKKDAFWDLTPFLQDTEAYPNLSQYNKDVASALTIDNKLIGLYRARELGRYGFGYRTDWAEAVGITEAPDTVEEVYDMLYKFTYNDPDGNGEDDTYGMEMTKYTGPFDIIQTWFGCGNGWVEQDGQLVPVHMTEEYDEAVQWIRKCYEDGLMRQDWATIDTSTWSDGVKKGEAGVFIDVMDSDKRIWQYFQQNNIMSVTNPDETASMTMVGPIAGKTLATSGYNGYFVITKAGAKTEEDVENCLHFLDKMCDDEMLVLANYGLEGITYDLNENGEIVPRTELDASQLPQTGLNQCQCFIPNLEPTNPSVEQDEPTQAMNEAYEKNREVAVMNPALGYLSNSDVNAEVGTDITQIIDDARTQYICGQLDDDGFAEAKQTWLDRGGQDLIDDVNRLYQEDTTK